MATYAEIDGSQTFVFKVIKEQFANISDENIKVRCNSIRAYGTIKNPLFSGIDVYLCLKNININATKQEIIISTTNIDRDLYKKLWNDEKVEDCIVPGVSRHTNLINEWGVIHACYLFKGDVPIIFQKFMREVIRQLKETGHASLADANSNLTKQLADEHERAGALERANFEQSYEIKRHADIEDIFENAELQGENEQKMYHLMQKKFLKPISVYVVDPNYVQSKKLKKKSNPKTKNPRSHTAHPLKKGQSSFEQYGLSESDEENSFDEKEDISQSGHYTDTDDLDYDYLRCNKYNLEADPNEEYYFFVATWMSKTINQNQVKQGVFKYAFDIYIENKSHYAYMIELINTADAKLTGIFKTTYSNIVEASQSSFINIATREMRKTVIVRQLTDSCELDILAQRVRGITSNKPAKEPIKKTKTRIQVSSDSSGSDVDGYNDTGY